MKYKMESNPGHQEMTTSKPKVAITAPDGRGNDKALLSIEDGKVILHKRSYNKQLTVKLVRDALDEWDRINGS